VPEKKKKKKCAIKDSSKGGQGFGSARKETMDWGEPNFLKDSSLDCERRGVACTGSAEPPAYGRGELSPFKEFLMVQKRKKSMKRRGQGKGSVSGRHDGKGKGVAGRDLDRRLCLKGKGTSHQKRSQSTRKKGNLKKNAQFGMAGADERGRTCFVARQTPEALAHLQKKKKCFVHAGDARG